MLQSRQEGVPELGREPHEEVEDGVIKSGVIVSPEMRQVPKRGRGGILRRCSRAGILDASRRRDIEGATEPEFESDRRVRSS